MVQPRLELPFRDSLGLPLQTRRFQGSYQEGIGTPPEGWIRSQVMNRPRGTSSGEQVDGTQYTYRRGSNPRVRFGIQDPLVKIFRPVHISGRTHYFAAGPRGPVSISDKKSPTRSFFIPFGTKGTVGLEHCT